MRVLISGTRHESSQIQKIVEEELDFLWKRYGSKLFLILGGAQGVDSYAESWARRKQVDHVVLYAKWSEFGRAAGPIRNELMFNQNPNWIICFLAPDSKGTRHVSSLASRRNLPLTEIEVVF